MSYRTVLSRDITLKNGTIFEAGDRISIRWEENRPGTAIVMFPDSVERKIKSIRLHEISEDFMEFTIDDLEDMTFDRMPTQTLTGEDVEPDGWIDGVPSVMLALGII